MNPLPTLSDDILLEILTHKSLRIDNAPKNEKYGDSGRLAELGRNILESAVTYFLFSKRPMLDSAEISVRRSEL